MVPQLWELEGKTEEVANNQFHDQVRLVLSGIYASKTTGHFARLSCFGGNQDQLVLCTEKGKEYLLVKHLLA